MGMLTAAQNTADLPFVVSDPPRRLNNHERRVLRRLIYTLAGRESWNLPTLVSEAITICDAKIAPHKRRRR